MRRVPSSPIVSIRHRIQFLQGFDEVIEDVVGKLEETGVLNNTYLTYRSDNAYHLGTYPMPTGKALPYLEDTNALFFVRGPDMPANVTSIIPSPHLDLAPTFLKPAELEQSERSEFFDGHSLLSSTYHLKSGSSTRSRAVSSNIATYTSSDDYDGDSREINNIEFWGLQEVKSIARDKYTQTSYKTLRNPRRAVPHTNTCLCQQ